MAVLILLTHSTGELAGAFLQQSDYLSLLGGGTAAANHSGTLARQLHKLILVVFQTNLQEARHNGGMSKLGPAKDLIFITSTSFTVKLLLRFRK